MDRTESLSAPLSVRASSPEDLLSLIPYLLGFRPERSLVTLFLRGGLLQLTARIDLPPSGSEVELARLTRHFATVAERHGASETIVATFTDDAVWSDRVVRQLDRALGRTGCEVIAAVNGHGDTYRVHGALGWTGPYHYRPSDTAAAAGAVAAGMSMLPDRSALAASVAQGPPTVVAATVAAAEAVDVTGSYGRRRAEMADLVASRLGGSEPLTAQDCAQLALLATDLEVRDVAWLAMERRTAQQHRQLWQQVAQRVPTVLSAAPLCLTGMAAWLDGDGALAWCCVERAEAEHPGYGMADLLAQLLISAVHPQLWEQLADGLAAV